MLGGPFGIFKLNVPAERLGFLGGPFGVFRLKMNFRLRLPADRLGILGGPSGNFLNYFVFIKFLEV